MPVLGHLTQADHVARQVPGVPDDADCSTTIVIRQSTIFVDGFSTAIPLPNIIRECREVITSTTSDAFATSSIPFTSGVSLSTPTPSTTSPTLISTPPATSTLSVSIQPVDFTSIAPPIVIASYPTIISMASLTTTSIATVGVSDISGSQTVRDRLAIILGAAVGGSILCASSIFACLCYSRRARQKARLLPQPFLGQPSADNGDVEHTDLLNIRTSLITKSSYETSREGTIVELELDSRETTVLGHPEKEIPSRPWRLFSKYFGSIAVSQNKTHP